MPDWLPWASVGGFMALILVFAYFLGFYHGEQHRRRMYERLRR